MDLTEMRKLIFFSSLFSCQSQEAIKKYVHTFVQSSGVYMQEEKKISDDNKQTSK